MPARRPQAQLGALVGDPLDALGIGITDVGIYATEIHNPEITEPQGGGDVADRNYKMLAGLGVLRDELTRADIPEFARAHGLPGFAPTQGHIASAIPWLPHAPRAHARGRSAPDDADGQGLAVPRTADAPVGRRVRDPRSMKGDTTWR